MRKLIHSDFEIDLSNYKITDVDSNPWFLDELTLKMAFPFTMELSEENDVFFGFISSYNTVPETIYNLLYAHGNQMEQAEMEIEELSDDKLSCTFTYGYDQIPSWEKKLSELPLDKFVLEDESIYEHAASINNLVWPNVNYNFPMIHIDKIDTDDDVWFAFRGMLNAFEEGAYLENEVDLDEEITYNRNIMQPLPAHLHVLQKGFEDAGLELTGEILEDPILKRKLMVADVDYYTSIAQESQSLFIMSEDADIQPFQVSSPFGGSTRNMAFYSKQLDIEQPGKYRLVGKVTLFFDTVLFSNFRIKYRNQTIANASPSITGPIPNKITLNVDLIIETLVDDQEDFIVIESRQRITENQVIAELDLNPIRLHDQSGEAVPSILNLNQIDLTRAVPDMTFGDFVKYIKNRYNYDLDVKDGQAIMNLIENEMNYQDASDLSAFEVEKPIRRFNKGISFELKFADVDTQEYQFPSVFHSATQITSTGYVTNEKTNIIEVQALPLPLVTRNGIQTAHFFESGNTKVYEVLYNGLQAGLPLVQDPTEISIPNIHESRFKKWFDFRINATTYRWRFLAYFDDIAGLRAKGKSFAYGRYLINKEIQRTEILPELFEVEIEAESLE
jgi:uncharacterized ubiquitin-like protein YukD